MNPTVQLLYCNCSTKQWTIKNNLGHNLGLVLLSIKGTMSKQLSLYQPRKRGLRRESFSSVGSIYHICRYVARDIILFAIHIRRLEFIDNNATL